MQWARTFCFCIHLFSYESKSSFNVAIGLHFFQAWPSLKTIRVPFYGNLNSIKKWVFKNLIRKLHKLFPLCLWVSSHTELVVWSTNGSSSIDCSACSSLSYGYVIVVLLHVILVAALKTYLMFSNNLFQYVLIVILLIHVWPISCMKLRDFL